MRYFCLSELSSYQCVMGEWLCLIYSFLETYEKYLVLRIEVFNYLVFGKI